MIVLYPGRTYNVIWQQKSSIQIPQPAELRPWQMSLCAEISSQGREAQIRPNLTQG
jgi:hypothetical protein